MGAARPAGAMRGLSRLEAVLVGGPLDEHGGAFFGGRLLGLLADQVGQAGGLTPPAKRASRTGFWASSGCARNALRSLYNSQICPRTFSMAARCSSLYGTSLASGRSA